MSDMWNDFEAPMPDGYSPPQGRVNALNSPSNPNCTTEGEGDEDLVVYGDRD